MMLDSKIFIYLSVIRFIQINYSKYSKMPIKWQFIEFNILK